MNHILSDILRRLRRTLARATSRAPFRSRRFRLSVLADVQPLEERVLLNGSPITEEVLLNTTTHRMQNSDSRSNQSVAGLPGGGFVAVWQSRRQDGSAWGVYGQRFDETGIKLGPEFRVNQTTRFSQRAPSVTVAADGRMAMAWQSFRADGSVNGLLARVYNADGTPATDQFNVNQATRGVQGNAAVSFLTDGNLVVTWHGRGTGDRFGIFARVFDQTGTPVSDEFRSNQFTKGLQHDPTVAGDSSGGFWIAWSGRGSSDFRAVYARRFSAEGTPLDDQFRINQYTKRTQSRAAIAASDDGRVLIGWQSRKQDGSALGVYARLFDVDGSPLRDEFQVNQTTKGLQYRPHLDFTSDGGFAVTWMGRSSGDRWSIYVREYGANAEPQTDERRVNITTRRLQFRPSISGTDDGFVVMWGGRGEGDRWGVFASVFREEEATEFDLLPIGNQTIDEGQPLSVLPTLFDGSIPADYFEVTTLPTGATFDAATGRIEWTPTEAQGPGTFEVTVSANGGDGQTDAESFTITVNEANSPPVLIPIADRSVAETNTLTFAASASDPDLPANTLSYSLVGVVPDGASVDLASGHFSWTPSESQGPEEYPITVRVDDGAGGSDEATFMVSVAEGTTAPVLAPIGNLTIDEQTQLTFTATGTDSDQPPNTMTFSLAVGAPAGASISSSTGIFTWTPTEEQGSESFDVTIVVDDDTGQRDSETVTITVNEVNQPPVLAALSNQTVPEDSTVAFIISATDPDLPTNTLSYSLTGTVPDGMTVDASTGQFNWTPSEAQGPGVYSMTVQVDDGAGGTDDVSFSITVDEVGQPPILAAIGSQTVDEESLLTFTAAANDPDSPPNRLTFGLGTGVPAGAAIDSSTGVFTWTPTEEQGPGTFNVTVMAEDGTGQSDSETVSITVNEVNQPPVLTTVADRTVSENATVAFMVAASDPDVPANTLSYSLLGTVPDGATIDPATGQFNWTPTEAQGPGVYPIMVQVDDGAGGTDDMSFSITVDEAGASPQLAAIGSQTVDELAELTFTASATDSDLPPNSLVFSLAAGAPAGAAIDSATGVFTWTPTEQNGPGVFGVTVFVDDGTGLSDSETVTFTVNEINRPPVLDSISNQVADETTTLMFTATASDPDLPANTLTFTLTGTVPAGAAIDPASGLFTWTPSETQGPGQFLLNVQVTDDGGLFDNLSFNVDVREVNHSPVIVPVSDQNIAAGEALSLIITASDSDVPKNELAFSLDEAPDGAGIDGDTGQFVWTPTDQQNGKTHQVVVRTTDELGEFDTHSFQILVGADESNVAPVITTVPDLDVASGRDYHYDVGAIDADGDTLSYSLRTASTGMAIVGTTGQLAWQPTVSDTGTHNVTVLVSDGRGGVAEQDFVLSVTEASPNRPPVILSDPVIAHQLGDDTRQYRTAPVRLDNWEPYQFSFDNRPDADWTIDRNSQRAQQTTSRKPSLLLSDFTLSNHRFEGKMQGDYFFRDGMNGLVFGYQDPSNFYLFDWKQLDSPNTSLGPAFAGMSIKRFSSDLELTASDLWQTEVRSEVGELLFHNDITWDRSEYELSLEQRPGHILLTITNDGNVLDTIELDLPGFSGGRVGFYTNEQEPTSFFDFTTKLLEGDDYRYRVEAFDSDGDALQFRLIEAPRDMRIGEQSGELVWQPNFQDVGGQRVVVEVADNRGGTVQQEFWVCVHPSSTNSAPQIVSAPRTEYGFDDPGNYVYRVEAVDGDGDALTFSLVDAPEGMRILPDTGEIVWEKADSKSFQVGYQLDGLRGVYTPGTKIPIEVSVYDGKGGVGNQAFDLYYTKSNPASISGYVFDDQNHNRIMDSSLIEGERPAVLFVVDSSQSMLLGAFPGDPVGDVNGDGYHDTPFDSLLDGILTFAETLRKPEFNVDPFLGVIDFSSLIDVNPAADGIQSFTSLFADADANGIYDFDESLRSMVAYSSVTNYEGALQRANEVFESSGGISSDLQMIFLSDGSPNWGGAYDDEVSQLLSKGVDLDAIAIGKPTDALRIIDDIPHTISNTGLMSDTFRLQDFRGFEIAEPGLPDRTVFIDKNGNGDLDGGERSTLTDADGRYEFDNLLPGVYNIRSLTPPGWTLRSPSRSSFDQVVFGGQDVRTLHFANEWRAADATGAAPVFVSMPNTSIESSQLFTYSAFATDIEGSKVTYDLVLGPENSTLHPDNGQLFWQPRLTDAGRFNFIVRATDGDGLGTNQAFAVDVMPNSAPFVTSLPPVVWPIGFTTEYHIRSSDAERDSVSYSILDGPADLDLEPQAGLVSWHPDASPLGILKSDDPIGVWRFNETDETNFVEDSSGNGNTGVAQDATVPKTTGPLGGTDTAALIDTGNGGRRSISYSGTETVLPQKFSAELWVNPSESTLGEMFGRPGGRDTSSGFSLGIFGTSVTFSVNRTRLRTELPTNTWTHVVGVFDRPHARLYVNGELVAEQTRNSAYIFNEAPLRTNGTGFAIDDLAFFDYALTEQQISSHFTRTIQQPRIAKVAVTDEHGAATIHRIEMFTDASHANSPPEIFSQLRNTIGIGQSLVQQIQVADDEGDLFEFQLDAAPQGMMIDDEGVVRWTPTADQLGDHRVVIRATDAQGAFALLDTSITVASQQSNTAPQITSRPTINAVRGALYAYAAEATDVDRDNLIWSLDEAPHGMSIDPLTGKLHWVPGEDQLGTFAVEINVTDPFSETDSQRFEMHVSCNNLAPAIVSIPPTSALAERSYSYGATAKDLENDALTWELAAAPDGMSIDPTTGLIQWIPTPNQIASHAITIGVSDGLNTSRQTYTVVVSNPDDFVDANDTTKGTKGNRAPIITSPPVYTTETGSLYEYQVTAGDPDGDTPLFTLLGTPPTGMQIDAGGLVTWSPAAIDAGDYVIGVQADDQRGGTATQQYLLSVTVNSPPQITSTPVETLTSGAIYNYIVKATDPDGDPLTYELDDAPDGMTINHFGRIRWNSLPSDTATQTVAVTVSDNRGQLASQSWQIGMVADAQAPDVGITVIVGQRSYIDDFQVDIGSVYTVRVGAQDNVDVARIKLLVNGSAVTLDSDGAITLSAATLGTVQLQAIATDTSGLEGTDEVVVTVIDPANSNRPRTDDPTLPTNPGLDPTDSSAPTVTITSPDLGTTVSNQVPIIGTVDDAEDNLWYYRAYYARADRIDLTDLDLDDPDWIVFHESTTEVIDGELAVFDSSLVGNDPYAIIIAAFDSNGLGYIQPTMVYVEGSVQVGNFQLGFTDLSIPLSGIPIQINRNYNTLNSQDEGDFGFGWTLGVQDARIFEATAVGAGGALNSGNDKFIPGKTKVYLTNPSGQRVGFTYKEDSPWGGLFGVIWRPYFEADPGVYDSLTIDETQVARGGLVGDFAQGINPTAYTLTTKEGVQYRYGDTDGLQTITGTNGNIVTFTDDGVLHSSGASIDFVRDARGRIKQIIGPAGNSIHYEYDTDGNLQRVIDQAGLESRYTYRTDPAHYLDEAFDSFGERVLKVEYDADGKFVGVVDAVGNRAEQSFDTLNNTGVVRDLNGNPTTLLYDDRGNVLEETDAAGNTIFREYNDLQNPDLETRVVDRRGIVTERTYDAQGNVLTIAEHGPQASPFAAPVITEFSYDAANNVTSITNGKGQSTTFAYDGSRNLNRIANAAGNSTSFTYDNQGRRQTFTDFNGNTTTFEYNDACPCGSPSAVMFADGTRQHFAYNSFGQVTLEEFFESDGTLVQRRENEYDALGRLIQEKVGVDGDADHPPTMIRRHYDGNLLDWEIIVNPASPDETPATPVGQRLSRITDFEYDANDRIVRQIDAEGGVAEFRYDANGNRVLLQDPVGNITTWIYDELNRVVEERDPFFNEGLTIGQAIAELSVPSGASTVLNLGADHVRAFEYDAEGNQIEIIDRNGRRREFTYDATGRLLEEVWFDATGIEVDRFVFTFDAIGNMLSALGPNSQYVFTYDALNRVRTIDNADGVAETPDVLLTYSYDAQGNVIGVVDDSGVTVASEYNGRNLLQFRRWFDADIPAGEVADVADARIDFAYNAVGRQSRVDRYSDLSGTTRIGSTDFHYDLSGRTDKLTHYDAIDEVFSAYDYGYDFSGLLTSEVRNHQDDAFDQSISYGYDLTAQLTEALFSGQDNETFLYDANGNRISSTTGTAATAYTTGTANQLDSDGTHRYEYDGEGNQIKRVHLTTGVTTTYEYDHQNRMIRVDDWSTDPGDPNAPVAGAILTQSVEYTYDVFGRRIARSVDADGQSAQPAEKEFFIYNGDNVWADFDAAGDAVARYLFGDRIDSNLARFRTGEGTAWYLTDKLGTVRDLVDSSGALLTHVDYRAFGTVLSGADLQAAGRYLFTGREFDSVIGQHYYRARTYDSVAGIFTQRDPLGFAGADSNLFRHVLNSPSNGTDPSGRLTFTQHTTVLMSVGALVSLGSEVVTGGEDYVVAAGRGALVGLTIAIGINFVIPAIVEKLTISFYLGTSLIAGVAAVGTAPFREAARPHVRLWLRQTLGRNVPSELVSFIEDVFFELIF